MTRISCDDIAALLSGLLDGEIDERLRHEVEIHLAGCRTCRGLLDEAEEADMLVRALLEEESSASGWNTDLENRILRSTTGREGWEVGRGPAGRRIRRLRRFAWSGWVAAAASVALAVVLVRNATPPSGGSSFIARDSAESAPATPVVPETSPSPSSSPSTDRVPDATSVAERRTSERDPRIASAAAAPGDGGTVADMLRRLGRGAAAIAAAVESAAPGERLLATAAPPSYGSDAVVLPAVSTPDQWAVVSFENPGEAPRLDEIGGPTADPARTARSFDELAEVLTQTEVALHVLAHTDESNGLRDVRDITEVVAMDDLLARLEEARDDVPADQAEDIRRAWLVLTRAETVSDRRDVAGLQRSIREYDLPHRLADLSRRYE